MSRLFRVLPKLLLKISWMCFTLGYFSGSNRKRVWTPILAPTSKYTSRHPSPNRDSRIGSKRGEISLEGKSLKSLEDRKYSASVDHSVMKNNPITKSKPLYRNLKFVIRISKRGLQQIFQSFLVCISETLEPIKLWCGGN
mmetsp:Transcript_6692/g.11956  ORF Transcript_6692/g.11956 Transcript_6692/m.11956 type:complete len:140 (-) Transcript_6692:80-499(-)